MYVLVNTCFVYNGETETSQREVGAVYGPFATREQAEDARVDMEFPNPEQVFIRKISTP